LLGLRRYEIWGNFGVLFRPRFDRVRERFAWAIGLLGENWKSRAPAARDGEAGACVVGIDGPGLEIFLGWTGPDFGFV
jgi:hypothetical protein